MDEPSQAFVSASDATVIRDGLEDGASKSLEMAFLTPPEKSTFSKGLSGASPQQPKLAAAGADGTLDSDVPAAAEGNHSLVVVLSDHANVHPQLARSEMLGGSRPSAL